MNNQIIQLYKEYTGRTPDKVEKLPASGSSRVYHRLTGPLTLIAAEGTVREENEAFIHITGQLAAAGIPVPQVRAASLDHMTYLQDDLGDLSLFHYIRLGREKGRWTASQIEMLRRVMRILPSIQYKGAEKIDFSKCYPQPEFNRRMIMWDLNYFKYCYLKVSGPEFQEDRLEDDFETMADILLKDNVKTFMYRDFQSRNIMIKDNEPYFIDYQGGRRGPALYDAASFLYQARAHYPSQLRARLFEDYLDAMEEFTAVDKAAMRRQLRHFVLFRLMQVLGAYGYRGYMQHKPHFLQSIPPALASLREILCGGYPEYPYLTEVLTKMCDEAARGTDLDNSMLTVRIMSFSYKKGLPADTTDNGGGFYFDCRSIHNPGRYEPYKQLCGLDQPVIEFLETKSEIAEFLEHACAMVDKSIETYMRRGFTSLMACFGCTGGQHRSVYSAEHLARHIAEKYGVRVELTHRELSIHKIIERKSK